MPDGKISISRAGDLGLEREMELWLLISGWRGTVSVNEVRAWSAGGEGEGGGEGWERRSRSGEMCFLLFRCPSSEVSSRRGQHGQAAIKIKPNAKSRVRSPTMTAGSLRSGSAGAVPPALCLEDQDPRRDLGWPEARPRHGRFSGIISGYLRAPERGPRGHGGQSNRIAHK